MSEQLVPQDGNGMRLVRVRLAWRWKETGTAGAGPWSHKTDVMEVLAETLNQRFRDRMEHWVEAERDDRG
jgi:hypothetical protein